MWEQTMQNTMASTIPVQRNSCGALPMGNFAQGTYYRLSRDQEPCTSRKSYMRSLTALQHLTLKSQSQCHTDAEGLDRQTDRQTDRKRVRQTDRLL